MQLSRNLRATACESGDIIHGDMVIRRTASNFHFTGIGFRHTSIPGKMWFNKIFTNWERFTGYIGSVFNSTCFSVVPYVCVWSFCMIAKHISTQHSVFRITANKCIVQLNMNAVNAEIERRGSERVTTFGYHHIVLLNQRIQTTQIGDGDRDSIRIKRIDACR